MAKRADIQIEIVSDKKNKTKTLSLIKAHNSKHIEQVSHNEARSQYLQAFFFCAYQMALLIIEGVFFSQEQSPTNTWMEILQKREKERRQEFMKTKKPQHTVCGVTATMKIKLTQCRRPATHVKEGR